MHLTLMDKAVLGGKGTVSIRLKNDQGLKFENVQAIKDADVQFAIKPGRMSEDGTVLGKYNNNTITLNKDLANNFTWDHDLGHFLIDNGMLTETDLYALFKRYVCLQGSTDLPFAGIMIQEHPTHNGTDSHPYRTPWTIIPG